MGAGAIDRERYDSYRRLRREGDAGVEDWDGVV
jgi:hypothetical protein